jgi:two-component system response regulator PrrA
MNASSLGKESPARLLVVDDEDVTRRSLAEILRLEGYKVEMAEGGRAAIALLSKQAFDLVLLDLKMPDVDGLQVMRYIRRDSATRAGVNNAGATHAGAYHVPRRGREVGEGEEVDSGNAWGGEEEGRVGVEIIMLTAHGSLESAIEALRQGASDYLLKPISPEALLRSVAEGLRKRKERMPAQTWAGVLIEPGNRAQLPGGITIDLAKREMYAGFALGQRIQLTPTEGKLLGVLLADPGRVFGHRELVRLVQGYDTKDWEAPEVLRPLVSRLRRKLSKLPGGIDWIRSVRGTGYVLEIEEKEENS